MTNEELKITIAKHCGYAPRKMWRYKMSCGDGSFGYAAGFSSEFMAGASLHMQETIQSKSGINKNDMYFITYDPPEEYDDWSHIPNYTEDLNAIHEAVNTLSFADWQTTYMIWLRSYMSEALEDWREQNPDKKSPDYLSFGPDQATAKQKAQALVEVIKRKNDLPKL
jgi:hypothetical protein